MKKLIALIIIGSFVLLACAPPPFKPFKPEIIKFEATPSYSVTDQINAIPKPQPPKRIYVKKISDKDFEVVATKEEATHIMLAPAEYAKVGALVKLTKTYKELVLDQEVLMNTYIDQINALKELLVMEQRKAEVYRELWISSENAYKYEVWEHKWDNRIHKASLYGITVGSLIVLLLLL